MAYLRQRAKSVWRRSILFKAQRVNLQSKFISLTLSVLTNIAGEHEAQLLNCLKTTGLELGLLVNFGSCHKAEIIRIANTNFHVFRG